MANRIASLYAEIGADTSGLKRGLQEADRGVKSTAQSMSFSWATAAAALAGVGYAAKQMYGELKAGADLELARSQFDNLAASIDTTSDALLNKLGDATSGMMSNADMITSASELISLGLAKDEESVVRLATTVSTLGLNMQQVIMTFANNSKMRLDALGLSVQRVDELTKELEANGFQGDAFDEAVLIALEEKMTLLGDASETTAGKLKRFEADVQNLKDAGRLVLVDFLTPTIDALGTLADIGQNGGDVIADITDEAIKGAASTEDLVEQYRKTSEQMEGMNGVGARLAGVHDDLGNAQNDLRKAIMASTDSAEDYIDAIWELDQKYSHLGGITEEYLRQEWEKAKVMDFNSRMVAGYNARLENYKMRTQEATVAATFGESAITLYANAQKYAADMAERARDREQRLYTQKMQTGLKVYQDEQRAIEELTRAQQAYTDTLRGDLISALQASDEETVNLNESMLGLLDAAGVAPERYGAAALALGEYDKTQMQAAMNAMIVEEGMRRLAQQFADGEINAGELRDAMEELVNGSPYTTTFDLEENDARNKLHEIAGMLDSLDGRVVRSRVEVDSAMPGGGVMPSPYPEPEGGLPPDKGGDKGGGAPANPAPPTGNTPMVNNFYNTQASPRQIASAISAYVPRG